MVARALYFAFLDGGCIESSPVDASYVYMYVCVYIYIYTYNIYIYTQWIHMCIFTLSPMALQAQLRRDDMSRAHYRVESDPGEVYVCLPACLCLKA